jgi:hypothetical protein
LSDAPAFCPMCGKPSPGGAVHDYHIPGKTASRGGSATTAAKKKQGNPLVGLIALVVLAALGWSVCNGALGGGSDITGRYVGWVPVDAGHGYALISVTNTGDSTETAKCTVEVTDDFGDAGWDVLDQPIDAGQTFRGRVPLTVQNNGAYKIDHGEVKDC